MFRPSEVPMFDEDDYDDDDGQPDLPWPTAGLPPYPGPRRGWRAPKVILLAVTAVIAATAGFLAVTAVRDVSASPAAASASPTTAAPNAGAAPSGGTGNLLPPGTGGGAIPTPGPGQLLHLEIGGKVTAVSATSITLGARGQSVTAAVASSTTVTGKVHGIGGVKVGDLVSAQITGTDGKLTATAIQDPASIP
jgi:hypothetical protein